MDVVLVEAIIWTSEAEVAKKVFVKDLFVVFQEKVACVRGSSDSIDTVVAINAHVTTKVISFEDSMTATKKVTLVSAAIVTTTATTTAVTREAI